MVLPNTAAVLPRVEEALATHEIFGAGQSIVDRTLTFYEFALDVLADRLPAAGSLRAALEDAGLERRYLVLGDPTIRAAIHAGLSATAEDISLTSQSIDGAFNAALGCLALEPNCGPLEQEAAMDCPLYLGAPPARPWVWCAERQRGVLLERFQALFKQEISTGTAQGTAILRTPDAQMYRALSAGAELLGTLLPKITPGLFLHVHTIAVVDVADIKYRDSESRADLFESASIDTIPGTIFLSPNSLRSAWHAAEALLHEAAHTRFFDLILTRLMLRPGYAPEHSPTIRAYWNPPVPWNPNDWPIDRALIAFHVYPHLALLFTAMHHYSESLFSLYAPAEGLDLTTAARTACARARYLGDQLRCSGSQHLGPDSHRLIDWLLDLVAELESCAAGEHQTPAPPSQRPAPVAS